MTSQPFSIVSWNINSIRARLERVLEWLDRHQPDVVCLQETKCEDAVFPFEPIGDLGYDVVHLGQKTYNGVAILSRGHAANVVRGFGDGGPEDGQSRLVRGDLAGPGGGPWTVASVYVPNGQSVGSDKYAFKLEWLARLARYAKEQNARGAPFVLCGDFNVAPAPIDVYDPVRWEGSVLFSPPEREAFARLLAAGAVDAFRALHPGEVSYTWWDYRMGAFPRNQGLRIDHFLLNDEARRRLVSVSVDREERGRERASDHAPVVARFA